MTENIITEKRKIGNMIKSNLFPHTHKKMYGIILLQNEEIVDFLLPGLECLPANFFVYSAKKIEGKENISGNIKISKDLIAGFDFIVTDNEVESLKDYLKKGITPIVPQNNYLSSILKEFDPMKNEGNCFLYQEGNKWSLYYSIVRYLENAKFPYDNRNLVKNVLEI